MKLSDMAEKMISTIVIVFFICLLASIIYYRSFDFLPFLFGLFLGSATSIFKVILLKHAVDKALTMKKERAGTYVAIQHFVRLVLSGAIMVVGAVVPQISLWGVVAGILSFQVATYIIRFSTRSLTNNSTKS